jgi:hypothetical protein
VFAYNECQKGVKAYFIALSQEEIPLGRPSRRWLDNIKMDFREIGWDCMDWIDLVQDRDQWTTLVNRVVKLRIP